MKTNLKNLGKPENQSSVLSKKLRYPRVFQQHLETNVDLFTWEHQEKNLILIINNWVWQDLEFWSKIIVCQDLEIWIAIHRRKNTKMSPH